VEAVEAVEKVVDAIHQEFRGARVRTYIPILVERRARNTRRAWRSPSIRPA
jgi:hypothetical protein